LLWNRRAPNIKRIPATKKAIRPCLGDDEGCLGRVLAGKYISCAVNPQTGNERNLALTSVEKKKTVVVVGGGPAGMEAARVAAVRGHEVNLIERGYKLGGNLLPAAVPEFKRDYRQLIDYYATQLKKLGVNTKLNTEATPELIRSMEPEVVFVAIGSSPIFPQIPGIDKEIVITAVDLLMNNPEIGQSVVIVGGNIVGVETALYLGRQGKRVTIVEMLDTIMRDMVWMNAQDIQRRFDGLESDRIDVNVMTNTKAVEIVDDGLIVVDKSGQKKTLKANKVVLAVGMEPNQDNLSDVLKATVPEIYRIGDCIRAGKVIDAVWAGFRTARLI
jgi:2-enoate reductase